ncbi:glycosyltransferase family protein [Catalinimonas niigatensis]|uniref:glycosyltransferase family protein n=1 Tax=Catalinimonas niigatensis TaxID=1397264 RepID=UPI002665047E|nr:glycosyltransferase family protein [Catalinimonas niigatensis]WPP51496.1 glycosyltransferase family protein [Catalinimonas niigatensis]
MKILYAIQGTGNGHVSRARDIVPLLQQKSDLDILISGVQADVSLPYPVTYQMRGMSFIFGKSGGVDLLETYKRTNTRQLWKDIQQFPVEKYDLIINDFEPISAWAAHLKKKLCISLSHQSAILAPQSPQPKKSDAFGKMVLRRYAPTAMRYGFHFAAFDENIFTPVIRKEIRNTDVKQKNHYTVYLPAFDDEKLIKRLKKVEDVKWHVFSKHTRHKYKDKNVRIKPIENESFIKSFASCEGILCGAGFETPAEALYLNKKLMVIPMKNQFEQQCNAAALDILGIPVLKNFKKKQIPKIKDWVQNGKSLEISYPDITEEIIDMVLAKHLHLKPHTNAL